MADPSTVSDGQFLSLWDNFYGFRLLKGCSDLSRSLKRMVCWMLRDFQKGGRLLRLYGWARLKRCCFSFLLGKQLASYILFPCFIRQTMTS
ncbi:hypothetical protein CEXT_770811 [Caerostris extrusa]|uniref:Uncharacterized protein n=1 Tax=Caerostris extrusa TaxID=172846 RepID=A0AAV4VUX2_CAEEX|nr:hypothetical protein CEXT_770811 [Caerostris extrusa]